MAKCRTKDIPMPKMKTHRGAKKRFKMTATGKIDKAALRAVLADSAINI